MKLVPVMQLHALLQSDLCNDLFDGYTFRISLALITRKKVLIGDLDLIFSLSSI
jgi:hypothetical protein